LYILNFRGVANLTVVSISQGHDVGDKHGEMSGTPSPRPPATPDRGDLKKKKKGIFGGLFGKKGKKPTNEKPTATERSSSRTRAMRSPMARKGKNEI
jgi:hypothetical protein